MRILVCGGRDFNDPFLMAHHLHKLEKIDIIISGCARGADSLGIRFAEIHNIPVLKFPADWKKYPKAAGPIRNQQMIDEGKPDMGIAFPGGRGTKDMISRLKKHNIPVMEIEYNIGD